MTGPTLWTAQSCAQTSPVILLGRGGGGTRLLSEGVGALGVFLGNRLNASNDSMEWVKTIYDLSIRQWEKPEPEAALETDTGPQELRNQAAVILDKKGLEVDQPWGWKLPETTLIAPMVKHAFPNARFIHLVRHPVTTCCRRSHMTSRNDTALGRAALGAAYRFIGRDAPLIDTDAEHIKNAASWAFQADVMLRFFAGGAFASPTLTLKYEDICTAPTKTAQTLADYLGMPEPQGALFSVDATRAAGKTPDATAAKEVWEICKTQAVQLGYNAQGATP